MFYHDSQGCDMMWQDLIGLSLVTYCPLFKVSPEQVLQCPCSARTRQSSDTFLVPRLALRLTFTTPLTATTLRPHPLTGARRLRSAGGTFHNRVGVALRTAPADSPRTLSMWPWSSKGEGRMADWVPFSSTASTALSLLDNYQAGRVRFTAPHPAPCALHCCATRVGGKGGAGREKGTEGWWSECVACESVERGSSRAHRGHAMTVCPLSSFPPSLKIALQATNIQFSTDLTAACCEISKHHNCTTTTLHPSWVLCQVVNHQDNLSSDG